MKKKIQQSSSSPAETLFADIVTSLFILTLFWRFAAFYGNRAQVQSDCQATGRGGHLEAEKPSIDLTLILLLKKNVRLASRLLNYSRAIGRVESEPPPSPVRRFFLGFLSVVGVIYISQRVSFCVGQRLWCFVFVAVEVNHSNFYSRILNAPIVTLLLTDCGGRNTQRPKRQIDTQRYRLHKFRTEQNTPGLGLIENGPNWARAGQFPFSSTSSLDIQCSRRRRWLWNRQTPCTWNQVVCWNKECCYHSAVALKGQSRNQ